MLSPVLPALSERDRKTRRQRAIENGNETEMEIESNDKTPPQVSVQQDDTMLSPAGRYSLRARLLNLPGGGDIAADVEEE